ncbi:CTP synthase-like isoform X2 [Bradysia coprophila]|uniref:CTP synthase-like isoform X2 n=1 Tax=Bradysia coprophila TaxID=38358 RepID=UPI00187DD588|nr:CTP synthase-like isoform X2 [Bradysia coprophila]
MCSRIASLVRCISTVNKQNKMKYILVTGGVISGVGKGIISSSLGTLLNSCDIPVTSIKIDPYINIDAGTFSPYEHGEVFVLDDGGEVDLDLGNYERFLDIKLHSDNNITTGKIYRQVIERERRGDFLGKTVQVIPHITNAIQEWVERVAARPVRNNITPQVCIVELGGTIGDIEGMPFVEAFRQLQYRIGRENICCVHVSLIPTPRSTGEPKTKPTQASVREVRRLGLTPDLIVCRSEKEVNDGVKEKISLHCDVATEQVICIPDLSSIYHVPLIMDEHNIIDFLKDRLKLDIKSPRPVKYLQQWRDLAKKMDKITREVNISLVGKYTKLEDSYTSVTKSLQHAATSVDYKLNLKFVDASHLEESTKIEDEVKYYEAWRSLCLSDGVIVPGGFGSRGMTGKILAAKWCRERRKPYLGICLGLQASVIEFARNVLKLQDANTTEIDPNTKHKLVIDMPEFTPEEKGGTMRLGARTSVFRENDNSVIRQLYGNQSTIIERHRHRYEVNPDYVEQLEQNGLKFVATDVEGKRMEIAQLDNHPFYVAVQFHPEYLSRPLKPSPPFLGLILASVNKLDRFLDHGCRLSPRDMSDVSDEADASYHGLQQLHRNCQVNDNCNGIHSSDNSERISK